MLRLRGDDAAPAADSGLLRQRWFFAFLLLCAVLCVLSVLFFDRPIAEWVEGLRPKTQRYAERLSQIGNGWVPILLLPPVYFFARFVWRHKTLSDWALFAAISQISSSILLHVSKIAFGRARPGLYLLEDVYTFDFFRLESAWRAFPSGHATTIMGLAVAVAILLPRYALVILLFGAAAGMMRVFSLAHFAGDVLAGFFLATLVTVFWAGFLRRRGWNLSLS